MLEQAVILCGGLGTRLGDLTASTPKPMLPVAGKPFLDHLIQETARFGIRRILLLAGRFGEQIVAAYDGQSRYGAAISVLVEPAPLGTGGALRFAREALDPHFLLMNGDSWIDADLTSFMLAWEKTLVEQPALQVQMLLQRIADAGRYGRVELADGLVAAFREKEAASAGKSGLINAGVYIIDRAIIGTMPTTGTCSLEVDVLPKLVAGHRVAGVCARENSFFIDIGIPETIVEAERSLIGVRTRPAVFFDRDGTLNRDRGYTHRPADLEWTPGAREAIAWANANGYFVFVVTNQAGVARGLYDEHAILDFHRAMQAGLFPLGAHIDAIEWCPHHVEGTVPAYTRACRRRKPAPGMLVDLLATWPVDVGRSVMIGDTEADMAAGEAAGVPSFRYIDGSVFDLLRSATANSD